MYLITHFICFICKHTRYSEIKLVWRYQRGNPCFEFHWRNLIFSLLRNKELLLFGTHFVKVYVWEMIWHSLLISYNGNEFNYFMTNMFEVSLSKSNLIFFKISFLRSSSWILDEKNGLTENRSTMSGTFFKRSTVQSYGNDWIHFSDHFMTYFVGIISIMKALI